jgi:hypothetical protein
MNQIRLTQTWKIHSRLTHSRRDGIILLSSGWPDGRGSELRRRVEESPHSTEHGAGETPGRGDLPDQGHRNKPPLQSGQGEKVV